jgi:hypothetical protein
MTSTLQRYASVLAELANRYTVWEAEEALQSEIGPGLFPRDGSQLEEEMAANLAERLLAHCTRVDMLNDVLRDFNELSDTADEVELVRKPWALTGDALREREAEARRMLERARGKR